MTSIDITGPAAVQVAAQLIDQLRTVGRKITELRDDMATNAERITQALESGDMPFGLRILAENGDTLFRQAEDLGQLAFKLGVSKDAVLATRRGEWVNPRDWGFARADLDAAFGFSK